MTLKKTMSDVPLKRWEDETVKSRIAKGYEYTERFPFDGQPPAVLDVLKNTNRTTPFKKIKEEP